MPSYRFYKLTSGKRIAASAEECDFDDDVPAFEQARTLANGQAIGVWQGKRFVANVEAESDASESDMQPGEDIWSWQQTTVSTKQDAAQMRFG